MKLLITYSARGACAFADCAGSRVRKKWRGLQRDVSLPDAKHQLLRKRNGRKKAAQASQQQVPSAHEGNASAGAKRFDRAGLSQVMGSNALRLTRGTAAGVVDAQGAGY